MRLPRLPVSRRRHEADIDFTVELMQACRERERDQARSERDAALNRAVELEQAIREFVASEDTHEPGPFVKDGNWHPGPCVEGGPRMEDVYPDGFQVCADEECFAYWPCDVERLRRVLDGHDRQEPQEPSRCYVCGGHWGGGRKIYLGGDVHWRHAECQPPKAADVQGHDRQPSQPTSGSEDWTGYLQARLQQGKPVEPGVYGVTGPITVPPEPDPPRKGRAVSEEDLRLMRLMNREADDDH